MTKEKQEEQQKQAAPENEKAPKKDIKKEVSDEKDDQTAKLKEEIVDLKKQLIDKDDKYLRAEAEIQNMTNHFNKERTQILKYDGQDLIKSILPMPDNPKRALAIEAVDDNGRQFKKGIRVVHGHLVRALNDHGITEIKAGGETFDPTLHQAVQTASVEKGQKPETVVNVLQVGHQLKDRVLCPAMAVVVQ